MSVLLVLTGASGAGKTSIYRELLRRDPSLWFSVSATDRARRPDEVDGRDYHYLSTEEFTTLRDAGGFLEWFEVYGDLKGTPRAPIEEHLAAGDDVLVEVDVQGALAVRAQHPEAFIVFVKAPSRAVQRQRLLDRGAADDPVSLERRLDRADAEERLADQFDAVVVNDDVDHAVTTILDLLAARRHPA
ncbi:MAG TPA: guanylate kinase [Acidimicrobiia bacterium]|nr:guanylate kinase [Acidimicrobiia bacterium]